jgi:hypothetical protein
VEDGNIFVDDGDGSDEHEPLDPPRRWRLLAIVILGLVVAVVVVIYTQRPSDELADYPPEASPVLITTQPTATTTSIPATTTTQTTTTLWLGGSTLLVRTEALCRTINPSVRTSDQWVAEVYVVDIVGVKVGLESFGIESEVARVRNDQGFQLVAILDPVLADLRHALDSMDNALEALREEAPDRWQHQVDLAERHCEQAITTLESIVSTLYTEQPPTARP